MPAVEAGVEPCPHLVCASLTRFLDGNQLLQVDWAPDALAALVEPDSGAPLVGMARAATEGLSATRVPYDRVCHVRSHSGRVDFVATVTYAVEPYDLVMAYRRWEREQARRGRGA